MQTNDTARARDALFSIPADLSRPEWVRVLMAAHASGISQSDADEWSKQGADYNAQAFRATWRSFKAAPGGVGMGTLIAIAKEHGFDESHQRQEMDFSDLLKQAPKATTKPQEPPKAPRPGMSASEVWGRCEPATVGHAYILAKRAAGVPLENLRVVPVGDSLRIMGESMAGALVVPCMAIDGTLSTLQLIPPPDIAARLKAADKPGKLNLPGHSVQGWFTVGTIEPGGVVHIVEGIGQAWACWQATGAAAVVCFGAGNMGKVAAALRQGDESAKLVLVPDVGKEGDAAKIAAEVGAAVAAMPPGKPSNYDASDYAQEHGVTELERLLEAASEPPKPAPRYKLLGSADIAALPALEWRVRGVLPATGLAALFGPSGSGKSFLALDLACSIVEGERWFDCRVEAAPVVYVCLEGESGFKLRAQAWEVNKGRRLPDGLGVVLQPFKLTMPIDVNDMAAVVPPGAVVFIDTLNRAAPSCDENASKDMGEILEAAKRLQALTGGLIVLVHHTGKDSTKGLRGHSSLHAALDSAVEVSRDSDRREWKVAKAKDGADGGAHPFTLKIEALATDKHGDLISSCVVQEGNSPAADVRSVRLPSGGNQKIALEAVRDLLKAAGPFNVKGSPDTCPPGRPAIELEIALPKIAERLTVAPERRGERAREAVTGLVSRGVLACDKGWIWIA